MNIRLTDVLTDQHGNYILPFFWQHGEEEARLREEMARIHESGIGAVCVESRPHPDFCGPQWWRDMDVIMDEARRRHMRVWVLDDAHFPTGFANGWIRDKYPERKKIFLTERHLDLAGPMSGASIPVGPWMETGERILAVIAARRSVTGAPDGTALEVTPNLRDDVLYWDIPDGYWRVYFVIETPRSSGNLDYINPIDADSCRVQLEAVYEPHYARYAADFGKTFAGFFSDEPNIGNDGSWFDCRIGRKPMVLPWRADLLPELNQAFGADATLHLPGLWHEHGPSTWGMRYAYMNLVSRLYGECFSAQLGDWCRAHGVEYIGHIVEDNDAHARLGMSAAHFFRAMSGQDMSGIDVVLCQIRPGLDQQAISWPGPEPADGEFYHYALGKLGASHAHLDPRKHGRAMCEIFGAYGWSLGLRFMKWMTDHMLVRGINYYVPHAFSPRDFPDPDCPPHFYARGKNPQFRHFKLLMEYTNRLCHLLNGGRHEAEAAVLYHAEAEWSGAAMSIKEPLRVLMQAQYDADVVPLDTLCGPDAAVRDGKLVINGEAFGCLILPWAERLPRAALERVCDLLAQGVRVLCVRAWPQEASEGAATELLAHIAGHPLAAKVDLEDLPARLRAWGMPGVDTRGQQPSLRRYHYRHDGYSVWMFFNESSHRALDTTVLLPGATHVAVYDAFSNRLLSHPTIAEPAGVRVPLALAPEESRVFVEGDIPAAMAPAYWSHALRVLPSRTRKWTVSCATAEQYPRFTPWRELDTLTNLCQPDALPDFTGTLRYETILDCDGEPHAPVYLDLEEVGETAEIWLNGHPLGVRLSRPYLTDVTGVVKPGANTLCVEVTNHLGYTMKDFLSRYYAREASGLLGPIQLLVSGTDY